MCGRFTLADISTDQIRDLFLLDDVPELGNRYNIAPGQPVAAVRFNRERARRELVPLLWGLVPSWAREPLPGARMINARAETVHQKPAYRGPLRYRRCIVPASGFYEWGGHNGGRRPYYLRKKGGGILAFAGLWDSWTSPDGGVLETCAIITAPAPSSLQWLHDRMPVILEPGQIGVWLDPEVQRPGDLLLLLEGPEDGMLEVWPVSRAVNNPANDSPLLIAPER
jgi:putative SOS response-associated peptidase YedK